MIEPSALLAQAPPVIVPAPRPPISPGAVAAAQAAKPKPGDAFSAVCVDVTEVRGAFYFTFTCKTANGQSKTVRNQDLVDSGSGPSNAAEAQPVAARTGAQQPMARTEGQQIMARTRQVREVQLLSDVVLTFVTIKALNPSSTVRLNISGGYSAAKDEFGEPRADVATIVR
jgi:hypothetical protein